MTEVWELELKGTGQRCETFSMFEEAFLKSFGAVGKNGGTYTTETNSTKHVPVLGKTVGSEILEFAVKAEHFCRADLSLFLSLWTHRCQCSRVILHCRGKIKHLH